MPSPKTHAARSQLPSEDTPLLQAGFSATSPTWNGAIASCQHSNTLPPPSPLLPIRRWSSTVALVLLCTSVLGILSVGFFAPAAAAQYAKEAVILDVSSLSVESFTDRGVRVHVQASVTVDADRVKNGAIRSFGRVGTWLARDVSADRTMVYIYLPDYGGLLGTATAPAMVIDIRNGHRTSIDFVSDVEMGSLDVVQRMANDYFTGGLGLVRVRGEAELVLKAGLLKLGAQRISEEMTFEGSTYK